MAARLTRPAYGVADGRASECWPMRSGRTRVLDLDGAGAMVVDRSSGVGAPSIAGRATTTTRSWSSARARPDLPKAVRHTHASLGLATAALGRRPGARPRRPLPGRHAALAHPGAVEPARRRGGRRHRPAAPALRPRRGAALHRDGADDARDGGGADRPGHGQPPAARGVRPLLAALHHVGRHPGHAERGRGGDRRARACGGSPPTATSEVPVIAANPVDDPGAWRLDSAGLPVGGVDAAGGRPRHRGRCSRRGRSARSRCCSAVGHGRLPARRGHAPTAFADGWYRTGDVGLARARGLGPPDRPLQGDDQGERVPGGAGRDRGRAACATPASSTAPCSGCPTSGPARCRVAAVQLDPGRRCRPTDLERLVADVAGHLQAPARASSWSTPSRARRRARCCAARCATSGRRGSATGRGPAEWTSGSRRSRWRLRDAAAQVVERLGPRTVADLDDAERAAKLDAAVDGVGLARAAHAGRRRRAAGLGGRGRGRRRGAGPRPGRQPRSLGPTLAAELRRLAGAPGGDRHGDGRLAPADSGGPRFSADGSAPALGGARRRGGEQRARCFVTVGTGHGWRNWRWPVDGCRGGRGPDPSRHCRCPALAGAASVLDQARAARGRRRRPLAGPRSGDRRAPTSSGPCGVRSTLATEYARRPPPVRGAHRVVPGGPAPAGRRLTSLTEGSRSVALHAAWAVDALPAGGGARARRRRQGLLRARRHARCARRPSRCTAASATPGSAWPTSSCAGPSSRAELLGGVGASLARVLRRSRGSEARWTSVTLPRSTSSGSACGPGWRETTRGSRPRRRPTSTGPARPPGTSRSTTPASSACRGRVEVGGHGLPSVYDVILDEELIAAGAPPRPSVGYLVQGLLRHGSADVQRRFLPGLVSGRERWCQGFSEPDAGSDLAVVAHPGGARRGRVRASPATRCGRATRTPPTGAWCWPAPTPTCPSTAGSPPSSSRWTSPGSSSGRCAMINGITREFGEVLFDGARVDAANMVGQPGEGWRAGHDRGEPRARARRARLRRPATASWSTSWCARCAQRPGRRSAPSSAASWPGPSSRPRCCAMPRLPAPVRAPRRDLARPGGLGGQAAHDLDRAGRRPCRPGDRAATGASDGDDTWLKVYLYSRAQSVMGGTSQIQRNLIAPRILELPTT